MYELDPGLTTAIPQTGLSDEMIANKGPNTPQGDNVGMYPDVMFSCAQCSPAAPIRNKIAQHPYVLKKSYRTINRQVILSFTKR
jgi:hypothetical protein